MKAAEERVKQLEAQLEVEKQTQVFLKQEIERLATVGGANNVS
jgi:cell division protein FtsB